MCGAVSTAQAAPEDLGGVRTAQLVAQRIQPVDDAVFRDARCALPGRRTFRRGQRIAVIGGVSIAVGVGFGSLAQRRWNNDRDASTPIVAGVTFGLVGAALIPVSVGIMVEGSLDASADTEARVGRSQFRYVSHTAYLAMGGVAMATAMLIASDADVASGTVICAFVAGALVAPHLEFDGAVRGLRKAGLIQVRVVPTGPGMAVVGRF
ncbi:MAG: hypothetical protein ACI855_001001 [Myxococcota bacterium]